MIKKQIEGKAKENKDAKRHLPLLKHASTVPCNSTEQVFTKPEINENILVNVFFLITPVREDKVEENQSN